MKKYGILIALVVLNSFLFAESAKYAGEVYKVGVGVRNLALGHTGNTDEQTTGLAYWNPALLAGNNDTKIEIMHSEEFGGLLTNDVISYKQNKAFSIVLGRIAIEDVQITEPDSPIVKKTVTNADYIMNVGFSRKILKLNLGLNLKTVYRSLSENTGWGFGVDLGMFHDFNQNVRWAANFRNMLPTMTIWENGTKESVPLEIESEVRFKFTAPIISKPAKLYAGFDGYTEGRDYSATISVGDVSFDPRIGLEINLLENLAILGGYYYENITAGVSASYKKWSINYALETSNDLDNTHRVSIGMEFGE